MTHLFVNEIVQGKNITHGYATYEETVVENFRTIFTKEQLWAEIDWIDNSPEDHGNKLIRFCQFIIYLTFHKKPKLSFGMVLIDCHSDIDAALDEYLMYGRENWDQERKDEFMRLFQEIQDDPETEQAIMTMWNDPRLS